jgi:hypothetical protein
MIKLFRSRPDGSFKARARERDADTDSRAVKSVADAINLVLKQADAERTGLKNVWTTYCACCSGRRKRHR